MRFNHATRLTSAFVLLLVSGATVLGTLFDALPAAAGQSRQDQPAPVVQGGAGAPAALGVSRNTPPSDLPVPQTLTLRAGTLLAVRVTDWLSSDQSLSRWKPLRGKCKRSRSAYKQSL